MREKIKGCECGLGAVVRGPYGPEGGHYFVCCRDWGCWSGRQEATEEAAVLAWNAVMRDREEGVIDDSARTD